MSREQAPTRAALLAELPMPAAAALAAAVRRLDLTLLCQCAMLVVCARDAVWEIREVRQVPAGALVELRATQGALAATVVVHEGGPLPVRLDSPPARWGLGPDAPPVPPDAAAYGDRVAARSAYVGHVLAAALAVPVPPEALAP